MSANQIAKGSVVSGMLAALVVAREFISTDRNSLADATIGTDDTRDAEDQEALDDYDQALVQIDAAIARATERQVPSSPANTGGPAFPTLEEHGVNSGMPGMTLRDYFIAHAPAEPQPWFSPVMPPPEAPLPTFAQMYRDHTPEEMRALSNFNDDWMRAEDVEEERVRNYLFQRQEQDKRGRQRGVLADRERYIQWPAAWADAMLAARDGGAA